MENLDLQIGFLEILEQLIHCGWAGLRQDLKYLRFDWVLFLVSVVNDGFLIEENLLSIVAKDLTGFRALSSSVQAACQILQISLVLSLLFLRSSVIHHQISPPRSLLFLPTY